MSDNEIRAAVKAAVMGALWNWNGTLNQQLGTHLTTAVLAALPALQQTREVRTIEELAALPDTSIVTWEEYGDRVAAVIEDGCASHTANDYWSGGLDRVGLPAAVVWFPEVTG